MPDASKPERSAPNAESGPTVSAELVLDLDPYSDKIRHKSHFFYQIVNGEIYVYVSGYLRGDEDMNCIWCFKLPTDLVTGAEAHTGFIEMVGCEHGNGLAPPGTYMPFDTLETRDQTIVLGRMACGAGMTVISTRSRVMVDRMVIYTEACDKVGDVLVVTKDNNTAIERILTVRDRKVIELTPGTEFEPLWNCRVIQEGVNPFAHKHEQIGNNRVAPTGWLDSFVIDGEIYTLEGVNYTGGNNREFDGQGTNGRYILRVLRGARAESDNWE